MSIYTNWGFSDTPFSTTALEPNALGSQLLVGRDVEVAQLRRRLDNPPKLPTIEGANGVGKTSLLNVTAFRAYQEHLATQRGPLFLPCRRSFQLDPDTSLDLFVREVYLEIGDTLYQAQLAHGNAADLSDQIERLITSPTASAVIQSLRALGRIPGAATATSPPDSDTFSNQVLTWLREIFHAQADGGVVCVLDNIELLQTSRTARRHVEQLRDRGLIQVGIRWVLCGASGIIRSTVSSPRMTGLLHEPIELGGMAEKHATEILPSRIAAYRVRPDCYLPIRPEDFESLYQILRGNLRAALGRADDYCMWIADNTLPQTEEQKAAKFTRWLDMVTNKHHDTVADKMPPKTREVFAKAVQKDGLFAPSDYREFGFSSPQALRPYVKILEDLGLVVSQQDEDDKRRKTISITPEGWLTEYAIARRSQSAAKLGPV